jgi:AcrR family transcriptional regulator
MTRRAPTGAAVLQPDVTTAITEAVLDELAEHGYARLSMEAVARRAGVSVGQAAAPDTGSLRGDIRQSLDSLMHWLSHPRFSRILPDLVAEMARNPELGKIVDGMIGQPRRERALAMFQRAIERGELDQETDVELALDLIASPIYWRLTVRDGHAEPGYLDKLATLISRALSI